MPPPVPLSVHPSMHRNRAPLLRPPPATHLLGHLLPTPPLPPPLLSIPPPDPWRLKPGACAALIKSCATATALNAAHAAMLRAQLLPGNLFLATALVSRYAVLGRTSPALAVFSLYASSGDAFLWNALIRGLADNGEHERAVAAYRRMRAESNVPPDRFTYPAVLKACAHLRDLELGRDVHWEAVELGLHRDVFVGNSLVAMYGKCGSVELAREVFEGMPKRNVVSFSAMIGAYAQNSCPDEALSLFRKMLQQKSFRPNRATFLNVIPCVCTSDEADELYGLIVEEGLALDMCIQNAAVGMYSKCGKIDLARRLFDGMVEKDLVSWSSMIEAYVQAELPVKALELFKQLKQQGMCTDYVTLLSVVRACSSLASIWQSRFIHGVTIRSVCEPNVVLETALIDLYVKCGSVQFARRLFDQMRDKNLISWSTMISGYGMHGHGRDALDLFDEMKRLVKPDHITYVSVLSACSHAGLIDEGWQCFNSMTKESGVLPRAEHYACMVDLLGRAGRLEEALEFIKQMPIAPDAGVWGSMLGACRIHSNVALAELAAKSLFELDSTNSGRYVLLSNIYTSSGKREDASRIRALMKQKGIKKTAGHTVIEVKHKVYKFLVGDRSNPQSELIYEELEKLMNRIREEGYVPNTNFVLHDVEEETKEQLLYVHSEKLAIVFGLLNSTPGSEIRMHKNLRVCGDCHTATKFISKVTRREILVRDSRRFHHFKLGECSCGDYW